MSGGAPTKEDGQVSTTDVGDNDASQQLDQEMKEDPPVVVTGASAAASTWNFVQMNMTLLPIARPRPVSISNRFHEGLIGRKPRTPNQKLHDRVLHHASNISPRRNEESGLLRRRGSASSDIGASSAAAYLLPRPTERQFSAPTSTDSRSSGGKRKAADDEEDHSGSSCWTAESDSDSDAAVRSRSFSEDLTASSYGKATSSESQHEVLMASRSTSTLSTFAHRGALFKDKRILEIQHEERRRIPDERAALPSPSKRSRLN